MTPCLLTDTYMYEQFDQFGYISYSCLATPLVIREAIYDGDSKWLKLQLTQLSYNSDNDYRRQQNTHCQHTSNVSVTSRPTRRRLSQPLSLLQSDLQ